MEEGGIIGQLGIDWKLFLSQAFNFFILLIILRAFVYKPLLKVIKKRSDVIKEGLEKALEADNRLKEVDIIAKNKLKEADQESIHIIKNTEQKAKQLEQALRTKLEEHQKELMNQAELSYERQLQEAKQNVLKNTSEIVKRLFIKVVELKPESIDEALIEKAVNSVKNEAK